MTCPKGLRNGPCGGTIDGACDVLPDRPCVWVEIGARAKPTPNQLSAPLDPRLVGTSSVLNYISGKDLDTRVPQPFYSATDGGSGKPSEFACKFDTGRAVITYAIASPRDQHGLPQVERIVERVRRHVDGINTTMGAGGVPSLHSLETARVVASTGVPPIVQYCGRDQDAGAFRKHAGQALSDGFSNILALTGDWNPKTPRELSSQHWFPMDSLQMVDQLSGQMGHVKKPYIGVASNPYMTPTSLSVDRFLNKLRAGASFTQTQVVTETQRFSQWLDKVRETPEGRQCRVLVSVPLVGHSKSLAVLEKLPGVQIDPAFKRSLEYGNCSVQAGLGAARHLIKGLLALNVDGVHLMNFGLPLDNVIELMDEIRSWPFQQTVS